MQNMPAKMTVLLAAAAPAAEVASITTWQRSLHWLRRTLPEGIRLPEREWESRHRTILILVAAHAVGLAFFGLYQGWGPAYALGEAGLIAALGLLGAWNKLSRRFRSAATALALVTSSAVLVQFWGGYIEGHFHFFIVVAVIAIYQDWIPFLLAILYVAVDHGAVGTLAPEWVYNHPDAFAHPWRWAFYHAVFVLGECAAVMVTWKASERARARTDLVLTSAGEGILGLDLRGHITFANPAAVQLAGRLGEELVGLSFPGLLKAGTAASAKPFQAHAPSDTSSRRAEEATLVRPDGQEIPIEYVATPYMENDAAVGLVVAVRDLRERRRADEERRKRVEQASELERLKELDKFKTLFINTAAHELRTPLTPLRVHVHVLKEGQKGALNPEQKKTLDVLDRNVERLSRLVEDVLNVARLQGRRLTLHRGPVDLDALVRESVEAFAEQAKAVGVKLETKLAARLKVDGDGKRLTQVFYNLLDNALKFTPAGGRVMIETSSGGDGAVVRIRDTGVGIHAPEMAKLFRPFSQVHDPMERTRAGSGLGLYISRGIVELHGGSITAESAGPGQGATFTILLPAFGAPVLAAP